jgi:hypothetical protein
MGIWHHPDPWSDDGLEKLHFVPFPGRSPNDYIPLLVLGYSIMQAQDMEKALAYSRNINRPPSLLARLFRSVFFWIFKR